METWFSIVSFVQTHALWYIAPFYMVVGFYVALVLGWFFSTDYYDKIYDYWDTGDDDFCAVHFICIFLIACFVGAIYLKGVDGIPTLIIATFLWLLFVLPGICYKLLELRKFLRKKRGKPL